MIDVTGMTGFFALIAALFLNATRLFYLKVYNFIAWRYS
jgi:hypothetical protein